MSELFDIACNFSSNRYDNDLDEVIKHAKNNNVTKFLVVSASINDVDKVYSIYQKYRSDCFFTVGTHPHHANEINSESMKKMRILVKDLKPCSVGETGLDFFRNLSTLEEQIFAFEEQIKLSIEFNKPLFLHQRDAHDEFIKIIMKYKNDINKASSLYKQLKICAESVIKGLDINKSELKAKQELMLEGWKIDYFEIRRQIDLKKPSYNDKKLVVLGAAFLGEIRLIDNIEFCIPTTN